MIQKKIRLANTEDIKRLCSAAVECPFDIDILSENYIIDAKSFMGIFSLNQRESILIRANADGSAAKEFFDQIADLCE